MEDLSIKEQLWTHSECKMFRRRKSLSVAMHKVHVRHGPVIILYTRKYPEPMHRLLL